MAILRLDITPDPDGEPFKMLVELDGASVYLQFRWNDRMGLWLLSVSAEDETPIATCISLVNNWDLLAPHRHDPRVPQGTLMAWAQTDGDTNAGQGELGGRVEVYYVEAS